MPEDIKPTAEYTEDKKRSSIRTYERDAARALREKNASLGSVFLAEQQKRAESLQFKEESPKKKGILFFMVGALLLLIASGAGYYSFLYINRDMTTVVIPKEFESAVIAERIEILDVTKSVMAEMDSKIISLMEGPVGERGTVTSFVFTEKEGEETKKLEIRELLNRLGFRPSGRLFRNLNESYALGMHSVGENKPFLVLTTGSYEQAFAGMLEWEPLLLSDLMPFFQEKKKVEASISSSTPSFATSTATTSESFIATTTEPLADESLKPIFEDGIIKNKDVRLLKNGDEILLIYAFPDRQTIVIADNEETFLEIISRLSAGRF